MDTADSILIMDFEVELMRFSKWPSKWQQLLRHLSSVTTITILLILHQGEKLSNTRFGEKLKQLFTIYLMFFGILDVELYQQNEHSS